MEKMDVSGYAAMLGLMAEMVWDESIRKHRTGTLYEEIDAALAAGDEQRFLQLTQELKTLLA